VKKRVINVIMSLLFSITLVLTLISLTILNKNFIMKVLVSEGYVEKITEDINMDLKQQNIEYVILKKDTNEYLRAYVKSRYEYQKKDYKNIASDTINKHIMFMGNKDYKMYSYIVYAITLLMIIIVGNAFLKSKKTHDLANVFIYSFLFLVIIYGIIYFNIENMDEIIRSVLNIFNHIILGASIILLEIGIYKKRFKKLS